MSIAPKEAFDAILPTGNAPPEQPDGNLLWPVNKSPNARDLCEELFAILDSEGLVTPGEIYPLSNQPAPTAACNETEATQPTFYQTAAGQIVPSNMIADNIHFIYNMEATDPFFETNINRFDGCLTSSGQQQASNGQSKPTTPTDACILPQLQSYQILPGPIEQVPAPEYLIPTEENNSVAMVPVTDQNGQVFMMPANFGYQAPPIANYIQNVAPDRIQTAISTGDPPSWKSGQLKCSVCGDKATGVHHGAAACEGCKGFFRRSLTKTEPYICRQFKKCEITRASRNRCQYCRLRKCVQMGMSSKSEHLLGEASALYPEWMCEPMPFQPASPPPPPAPNQQPRIQYHKRDINETSIVINNLIELTHYCHRKALGEFTTQVDRAGLESPDPQIRALANVASGFLCPAEMYFICHLAIRLREFANLPQPTQHALLQGAVLDIALLRLCQGFSYSTRDREQFFISKWSSKITEHDLWRIGFLCDPSSFHRLIEIAHLMRILAPYEGEMSLLMGILLFNEMRSPNEHREEIKQLHGKWVEMLGTVGGHTNRTAWLERVTTLLKNASDSARSSMMTTWSTDLGGIPPAISRFLW